MPGGVPVATVALDGAHNAGILAAQILGCNDEKIAKSLEKYKEDLKSKVLQSAKDLEDHGYRGKGIGFNS